MKILMVSVHFNLPGDSVPVGGVQKHISKITEEFLNRGYQIYWCYPSEVKAEIENFKPDLVIAHDFCSFTENISIPQIAVFHGWEGRLPINEAVIQRRQEVEKKAVSSICVGDYIRIWYKQNPNLIIYGGSSIVDIKTPPRKNKLCYIGRLAPDCSPHLFLRAVKLTENPYHLEILGDGSLKSELEELAGQLGISVCFRGFVDNVKDYIQDSDIVLTSGYLSILEGYIGKRPVISVYDNPLKKDYLSLMPCAPFSFNSVCEMAKTIDDIYEKGIGEQLEINYQFALNNTWKKLVDKYEEIIRNV